MTRDQHLSTAAIGEIFSQAIGEQGGRILDILDDGELLIVRATLSGTEEIFSGDRFHNGVALFLANDMIKLHPYVYRVVCKNGMIRARTVGAQILENVHSRVRTELTESLCEAIAACCSDEVFAQTSDGIRKLRDFSAELAINLIPLLLELASLTGSTGLRALTDMVTTQDATMYDVLNAVTSTARDMRDPEVRWELEEFAGRIVDCPDLWLPPRRSFEMRFPVTEEMVVQ